MLPSPMKAFRRGSSTPKERSPDELHLAVLTGRTKRIKHMLRKGVHIESVNSHGQTPLFCASFGGDVEVVQLLLRLGANPNRRCGVNGATPVHGAVYRGSRRVLRLLAETGGELTLKDNLEQTPRDYALKQPSPIRRQKILQFLEILLSSMTLHHGLPGQYGTLLSHSSKNKTLSLKRDGSMANVWGACLNESANSTLNRNTKSFTPQPQANLHKSVACHVLDQMYVSTSLPLLSPADLKKPDSSQQAYTCGGPTVYSPHTWLGTNVTVRKPTPALCLPRIIVPKGENKNGPDEGAVKSLVSELAVLRRLRHPGFLEVMAACHITDPQPDHITLVFQHIPLGTLYHHLHVQHLDLSIGAAVDILLGLVEALLFLHAHGWYHAGISSHALHLATNRHAKLGNFEFAIEFHGKESSMKVPELLRAAWLQAWQAPETLMEQMVSTRSEIYAFAAILWEIWSGMPPWSGVEEDEITRRVGAGDTLPPVGGTAPSLVTYLTEYGLKWNAHERELDLQEIHTMLRSLRLQADEEERVPSVPAWGPPSIPNTPVCGRSNQKLKAAQQSKRNSVHGAQGNSKENKNADVINRNTSLVTDSLLRNLEVKVANENLKSKKSKKSSQHKDINANPVKKDGIQSSTLKAQVHEPQSIRKQSSVVQQSSSSSIDVREGIAASGAATNSGNNVVGKVEMALSADSGFSTPCTRTPSPTNDTITSAKINPVMLTSTPVKASISSVLRVDMQPDLLPNKVNIKNFSHGQTSNYRPDILAQSPIIGAERSYRRATMATLMPVDTESDIETSRTSSPSDDNESIYDYITNPAKRAFFSESEGSQELDPFTPERPSSASKLEKKSLRSRASSALRQCEVVRRGLSLTNISSFTSTTSVTRTTSHVSLTSNSSSSASDPGSRRPRRTVSQISITLKKLTHISDYSSSSKDELSEPQSEPPQRSRRSRSVPKSPPYLNSSSESKRGWEENKAIKPASHQLTRHSSNCSLASNPASPTHKHQHQSWLAQNTPPTKARNIREGSQTLQHTNKNKQVPVGRRWNSVSGASGTPLADAAVKINPRRHSEGVRPRARRNRRRQEVEFEEEFFDDEFNATLFQQPHMQLSVGSSENLLDSRLDSSVATHSMLADGTVSPVSLGCRFSPGLTSSEDEEDEAITRERRLKAIISGRSTRLGALLEDADSQEEDGKTSLDKDIAKACQEISENFNDTGDVYDSDDLSGPWRVEDLKKDYEPLKSVELLRNLEKNLKSYLPTYSIASDTESSGP